MKIAVCDDEALCREQVLELVQNYAAEHPEAEIIISAYEHADDLMCEVKKIGGFDIYILDIIMPHTNGVKLGVQLRADGYDGKIIYLTSSEDYAIESFRAQPFHYIIKPVRRETLFPVLDLAVTMLRHRKDANIIVRTADGTIRLPLEGILYAELQKNTICYHMTSGRVIRSSTIRTSFAEAAKMLIEDRRFARCGASLIINLLHVTVSKTEELQFRDGSSLQLSRKLLAEIRTKWYDYWLDSEEDAL